MRLRFPCRSRLLPAAAALAGTLLLAVSARADIQNPRRSSFPGDRANERQGIERPPNGVSQAVGVVEGGSVTVVLRARGHNGEMVDFLIRTPPAHGTLDADPRQLTLNTAAVVYTPRPGDNAAEDTFTYAVQTRGSPVSAEATVTIRIQEPPPVLALSPGELDFGAVKVGESTHAELTLTNQGGGEAVGRLDPPPPWVVEGPAEYHLPRGVSQTFALVFKPQNGRVYTESVHFRYETGGGVRLVGTGLGGPAQSLAQARPGAVLPLAGTSAVTSQNVGAQALAPVADATPRPGSPGTGTATAAASPAAAVGSGTASLEPNFPGGVPTAPGGGVVVPTETDEGAVGALDLIDRSRSTLDVRWRVPAPTPRGYRVEIRYLSLDQDDRLVVDWRPYAQVEYLASSGFMTAHLFGLSPETQVSLRVVSVDNAGRFATPSPLVVVYTLPPSTWWRPTALKVLFGLLVICGGMVWRSRWETGQILREIDESRARRTAMR